jgi:hypothetical protein
MSPLIAITNHDIGADLHPIRATIDVVDDFNTAHADNLYRVMLHEFGHTIRLGHSGLREFIMYAGQPLPADIADDEAEVVILHHSLPTRVDMSIYEDAIP